MVKENLKILINGDDHFKPLSEMELSNSICYFKHNKKLSFSYFSPISLRYVHSGTIDYKCGNTYRNVSSNKFFLLAVPKMIQTRIESEQEVDGLTLFFDEQLIKELLALKTSGLTSLLDHMGDLDTFIIEELLIPKMDNSLSSNLALILTMLENDNDSGLYSIFRNVIHTILDYNIDNFERSEDLALSKISTKKEIIRRLYLGKCFIHDNFNKNIGLEDIARSAFLSKYCFQRHFRKFFNISPTEYLVKLRLTNAERLIKTKKHSIASISSQCGFNSPQYFNHSFKNEYGYAPSSVIEPLA